MPPKTCIASALTSQPASVPKALAIGVRNAARAAQASSPVAVAMSIESAQSRQIARAVATVAVIVSSIRRTSAWPMIVGMPSTGVRPCRRSRAKAERRLQRRVGLAPAPARRPRAGRCSSS